MANSQSTGVVRIQLANGKGVALIDVEDAERIPLNGWCRHPVGYAAKNFWDPSRTPRQFGVLLHRLVMGAQKGQEVDHINGDKLDCRKCNLRFVTRSQNNQNLRGANRTNRLGIRGVSTQRNGYTYYARVGINGKTYCRCGFQTVAEAEAAAIELRKQYLTHSTEKPRG